MRIIIALLLLFTVFTVSAQEDRAGYYLKKASEQGKAALRYQIASVACFAAAPVPYFISASSGKPNYVATIVLSGAGIGLGIASMASHAAAWNSLNEAGDRLRIVILPQGTVGIACRF